MDDPQVLIVDNKLESCLLLENMLGSMDIKSVYVSSIKATRDLMSKMKPSVVMIDQKLPDGWGFDLIPEIRAHYPHSRIIAMDSDEATQTKVAAFIAGADEFLEKPITLKKVCSAMFGVTVE